MLHTFFCLTSLIPNIRLTFHTRGNTKDLACFYPCKFLHLLPLQLSKPTQPSIPVATIASWFIIFPIFGNPWGCDFLGNRLNKNKIQSGITRSCPTFGTHVGGSCMWPAWFESKNRRKFPVENWEMFIRMDVFNDFQVCRESWESKTGLMLMLKDQFNVGK